MSVVMAIIAVSKCVITQKDHTIVFASMAIYSMMMAIHVKV